MSVFPHYRQDYILCDGTNLLHIAWQGWYKLRIHHWILHQPADMTKVSPIETSVISAGDVFLTYILCVLHLPIWYSVYHSSVLPMSVVCTVVHKTCYGWATTIMEKSIIVLIDHSLVISIIYPYRHESFWHWSTRNIGGVSTLGQVCHFLGSEHW